MDGSIRGVFKSTDSGATWNATNTGLTDLYLNALVIDLTNPSTLYAGTTDGIFQSASSGGTWTAANTGLAALDARALAIDPTNPAALYAGTGGRGVFKSTDAGGTWTTVNTGLDPHSYIYALAIDPTNPATVYACTDFHRVSKSTDSGGTWAAASTGMVYTASALAIDPTNPATLYAGTQGFFAGGPIGMSHGGVHKSTDSAGTWTRASTGLEGERVRAVAIDPSTPDTVYAGACYDVVYGFRSGGGVTSLSIGALVIHPVKPATLYAGTAGGVFKSGDAGATWTAVNRGLPNLGIGVLALDPTGSTTVYAGLGPGGVWQSTPPTEMNSPTDFHTLAPCRVIDTRNATGMFGGPALVAGDDRVFPLFGRCNIPSTAWAVSVNLTVMQPTAQGNLRLYPARTPLPTVSSINYVAGQTRANNRGRDAQRSRGVVRLVRSGLRDCPLHPRRERLLRVTVPSTTSEASAQRRTSGVRHSS